jgi:hypothetical protein
MWDGVERPRDEWQAEESNYGGIGDERFSPCGCAESYDGPSGVGGGLQTIWLFTCSDTELLRLIVSDLGDLSSLLNGITTP